MTDRKPTAVEIAQAALEKAEAALAMNSETNAMIKEIHDAWMKPHPVYGNRSLLDVVSNVAARASAGEIVGERIVWYAKVMGALSALGALIWWGSKP